jgi:hypothetical protein
MYLHRLLREAATFGVFTGNWAKAIAGLFSFIACVISFRQIADYHRRCAYPKMKNFTIRILMMVPVYALESWLGLMLHEYSEIFEFMRALYESLVIFSFVQYLLEYLGGTVELGNITAGCPECEHIFPMKCVAKRWDMGPIFVYNTVRGVLQYTVVMPIATLASLVSWGTNVYGVGCGNGFLCAKPYVRPSQSAAHCTHCTRFDPCTHIQVLLVVNFSQMYAIYCLVHFYRGLKTKMAKISPLRKLVTIKALVFFTFWQGVLMAGLVHFEILDQSLWGEGTTWTTDEIAHGIQDFVVCFEMMLFAIAHGSTFRVEEINSLDGAVHQDGCEVTPGALAALAVHRDAVNFFDIGEEFGNLRQLREVAEDQQDMVSPVAVDATAL